MKSIIVALLSVFLCFTMHLKAEITESTSLAPFEQALDEAKNDCLVIFDVDDVLITCSDPTLQEVNKESLDKVCQTLAQTMPMDEYARLFSIALKSREVEIIDQKIYDLLNELSHRNVKTIALTHTRTGQFGTIEKMEDWRISELNDLGINFNQTSPFVSEGSLKNLEGTVGSPSIKNGVIFTAEIDKGKVLEEAFKLLPNKPKEVIFIDDRMDNLRSVESLCAKYQIAFQGFHYTAVQARASKKIDEKLIEIQLDTLMKEGRWITSEEAAESFNDEQH
ncbi:MAG: hypothetical protein S4CHLAM6_06200 [Chlamydiae bacterium]|nr:hypothetical protein [Chlamydiota bacterium]